MENLWVDLVLFCYIKSCLPWDILRSWGHGNSVVVKYLCVRVFWLLGWLSPSISFLIKKDKYLKWLSGKINVGIKRKKKFLQIVLIYFKFFSKDRHCRSLYFSSYSPPPTAFQFLLNKKVLHKPHIFLKKKLNDFDYSYTSPVLFFKKKKEGFFTILMTGWVCVYVFLLLLYEPLPSRQTSVPSVCFLFILWHNSLCAYVGMQFVCVCRW